MVDPTRNRYYDITIQCSLDGFCFVVYDLELNRIVDLQTYQTSGSDDETTLLKTIEKYLYDQGLYGQTFHSIRYIVSNRFNTLIPEELFDEVPSRSVMPELSIKAIWSQKLLSSSEDMILFFFAPIAIMRSLHLPLFAQQD